jgi:hypothetical protein
MVFDVARRSRFVVLEAYFFDIFPGFKARVRCASKVTYI